MHPRNLRAFRQIAIVPALVTLTLNACSSTVGMIGNKLDRLTGVTISYSQSPMVFYRDVSGRAAFARDYIHVAPLEVNRGGSYRYYLWLGIWNTMEDVRSDQSRNSFESIVIYSDGEPLNLEIKGWNPAAIGASEPVYLKPVASATDAYYEVTIDQLRLIAEAKTVRVQSTGSLRASYELWDDQKAAKAGLLEFLNSSLY